MKRRITNIRCVFLRYANRIERREKRSTRLINYERLRVCGDFSRVLRPLSLGSSRAGVTHVESVLSSRGDATVHLAHRRRQN